MKVPFTPINSYFLLFEIFLDCSGLGVTVRYLLPRTDRNVAADST
jgi:hypothetical protein